jgi:predicted extracellular nuclease
MCLAAAMPMRVTAQIVATEVLISQIQGSTNLPDMAQVGGPTGADISPLVGDLVQVQAIVTADFQESDSLGGFYIQEPGPGYQHQLHTHPCR